MMSNQWLKFLFKKIKIYTKMGFPIINYGHKRILKTGRNMMKKLLIAAAFSLAGTIAGIGTLSAQNAAPAAPAGNSVSFSGGASTVQETFQDWTVSCGVQEGKKICSVSQQQVQNNGQRVMAIEVIPSASDSKINLVLPFGLRLADGISYRIDNGKEARAEFNTCYPGGCVANLPLSNELVSGLKSGQNLILTGKAFDGGQDVPLTVSLKGFSAGLDRAVSLQQ